MRKRKRTKKEWSHQRTAKHSDDPGKNHKGSLRVNDTTDSGHIQTEKLYTESTEAFTEREEVLRAAYEEAKRAYGGDPIEVIWMHGYQEGLKASEFFRRLP